MTQINIDGNELASQVAKLRKLESSLRMTVKKTDKGEGTGSAQKTALLLEEDFDGARAALLTLVSNSAAFYQNVLNSMKGADANAAQGFGGVR